MADTLCFTVRAEIAIGDPDIDAQHEQFMRLAEIVRSAICDGLGDVVAAKVLAAIHECVAYHFDDEERYFRKIGSPLLEQHIREHAILREELDALVKDSSLDFIPLAESVLEWLDVRLIPHILFDDRAAVDFWRDGTVPPSAAPGGRKP